MRKLAILLAFVPTIAQAAPPACVKPHDMRTLLRVALPDAVEGLAARCKPVLPPDAFLPTEGAALANRFRHEAPVDPAKLRAAIEAATGRDLSAVADDKTMETIANQFIANAIQERVATKDCDSVDGLVAMISPLHADAMAEALLLALEAMKPGDVKGLAICRPSAESAPR